jgi:hypothetical protein
MFPRDTASLSFTGERLIRTCGARSGRQQHDHTLVRHDMYFSLTQRELDAVVCGALLIKQAQHQPMEQERRACGFRSGDGSISSVWRRRPRCSRERLDIADASL